MAKLILGKGKMMKSVNKTRKLALALFLFGMLALTPAAMAAVVSTDKADYAPDEVVIISGSGFNTDTVITVSIVGPDGWFGQGEDGLADVDVFDSMNVPEWVISWELVGSDGFTIEYYKGLCQGEFKVLVEDSAGNAATTTFTDSRPLQFKETGLPSGTTWQVTVPSLSPSTKTSISDTISFGNVTEGGTYPFTVLSPISGYVASPLSGTASVPSGSGPVTVSITFALPSDTTPPDTSILTGPPALTNNSGASFTFVGTDDVTPPGSLTFECSLDGGAYSAGTSPKSYSGLTNGTHTFRVRAKDAANNVDPTPAEYSWTIDTTPPVTTCTLSGTLVFLGDYYVSNVDVALAATDPSPGSGVATTEYRLNGGSWMPYAGTFTISTEGTTTVDYRSTDNAGNVEAYNTRQFYIDKTPPVLELGLGGTKGNNDWYISDVTVSLLGSEGLSRLKRVEYSVNGGAYEAFDGSLAFSVSADGYYTVHCITYDIDGGEYDGVPANVLFKIDQTPPELTASISPAITGWYNADTGQPTVSFSCSDTGGSGLAGDCPADVVVDEGANQSVSAGPIYDLAGNPSVVATISGINVDITPPTVTITAPTDGSYWQTVFLPALAYTVSDNSDGWAGVPAPTEHVEGWSDAEGEHIIIVSATDAAGNVDSDSVTYTVDNTPPVVTITAPTDGAYYKTADVPTGAFNVVEANPYYTVSETGWANTPEDPHTYIVTATDAAGNAGSDSVTYTVDNTPPVITITTPSNGAVYLLNQVVVADWEASDALSGLASASGTVPDGAPIDTSPVGAKTFTVTATDNAGNTGTKTVTYSIIYTFVGFLPPVDNPPVVNVGKAGRTFPIKWQLKDYNGNFISDLSVVLFNPLRYRQIAIGGGYSTDYVAGETSGQTVLRYDSTSNQYIFNWQTSKTFAGKSYELFLELNDGTVHNVLFTFTK